jgi:hypothetical protein
MAAESMRVRPLRSFNATTFTPAMSANALAVSWVMYPWTAASLIKRFTADSMRLIVFGDKDVSAARSARHRWRSHAIGVTTRQEPHLHPYQDLFLHMCMRKPGIARCIPERAMRDRIIHWRVAGFSFVMMIWTNTLGCCMLIFGTCFTHRQGR